MATLAVLNTLVTANTNAFVKNMGKTSGVITSVGASMSKMIGIAAGVGAAVVGFNSLRGAVDRVRESMNAIDETAKAAQSIGESVEAISSLQYAASLAGASNEELVNGLKFMQRNIVEAADGSAALQAAFDKLGLSAESLIGLSAEESFKRIADGIAGVSNASERTAIAMDIFGRSGATLIPLLSQGSVALSNFQKEAFKVGAAYSTIDATKVEMANDALNAMNKVISSISVQLAIGLSPYIEAAAKKFIDVATSGTSMGERVTSAIEGVALGIAQASRVLDALKGGWYSLRFAAIQAITKIIEGLAKAGRAIEKVLSAVGQEVDLTSTLDYMAKDLASESASLAAKAAKAFNDAWHGTRANAIKAEFDAIRKQADEIAKLREVSAKVAPLINSILSPFGSKGITPSIDFEKVAKQIGGMILDVTGSAAGAVADKIRNEAAGTASAILADSAEARSITFNARNTRNDKQNEIAANTKRTADGQREVVAAIDRAFGNVAVLSL